MRKAFIVSLLIVVSLLFAASTFAQTATESRQINYQLPYPGILPDSPLYFFKVLRDKIEEFLISDPLKKAEFDLLSADKRLSMGTALFDKKEYSLSESTISKGENYSEKGLKNIENMEREGRAVDPGLLVSFDLSTKKHREVLKDLIRRSNGSVKKNFLNDLKRILELISEVSKLKTQQQP